MSVIILILVICVALLFNNFYILKNDNKFLKSILEKYARELSDLKKEVSELKSTSLHKETSVPTTTPEVYQEEPEIKNIPIVEEPEPLIIVPKTPITEEIPTIREDKKTEFSSVIFENHPLPKFEKTKPKEKKPYQESAFSIFLKKVEKQFADNWTGILGTGIMVLGIGYLSIYTALKVEPLFRVLILWLYAGLLIGSHYLLQKKEKWQTTGLWMRSAGASLFLFGCFGASQIEPLTFITNNTLGYLLIGLGITLNLYVGYIIKKQTFLSLHVILSILILCVIPEKLLITFILAAITSIIGIVLSYKEKWEYHILIVIIAFIIFDIWFNTEETNLTATQNIFAILSIVAVSGSCIFMQYRNIYKNSYFDKAAFITHVTNWILFGIGLILHSTGSSFKTFLLFIGAVLCFLLALKARNKKVFWLYNLDGMVAFVLACLSIIMLNDWNIGIDIIISILYLFTVVCLFITYQQKEILLHKILLGFNHFMVTVLFIFCLLLISNSIEETKTTSSLVSFTLLTIISISVPIISSIKKNFSNVDFFYIERNLSLNGLFSILFSVFLIIKTSSIDGNYYYYTIVALGLLWCFLKKNYDSKTFDIGRIFFLGLSILAGFIQIKIQEKSISDLFIVLGLSSVIAFNWTQKRFYNNLSVIPFISIVGLNLVLISVTFKYLSKYEIIHIFSLCSIGLLNHEFLWHNYKKRTLSIENETLLYILYYLLIFIGSFLLLLNLSELSTTEIGLTCLGISIVEMYVLFAKRIKNKSEEITTQWYAFHTFNSELLLFNVLLFGFSCFQDEFKTVVLSTVAVISYIAYQRYPEFKRHNNYAFILVVICFLLSIYQSIESINLLHKTTLYITQFTSVLITIVYYWFIFQTKKETINYSVKLTPYLLNLWIVTLLFIQIEFGYIPLLLMGLALLNYWLISQKIIHSKLHFSSLIGVLAIISSIIYCFSELHNFKATDWILQLGSFSLGTILVIILNKKEKNISSNNNYQIVLNLWLSSIMLSQLEHKWLALFWAATAILNLYLYQRKISTNKNINITYYLLSNLHLGFISFHFYNPDYLWAYLLNFLLLGVYLYFAYKWMENFVLKNSLMIYPATLSIGCFLYLTFDKGALTFFWILEALGLLILGIILKEKYFRYVSLSLVGICIIRLMFFDLSNADFLIRALVLLGVGVVLLVMNSLFKKYKDRFD